MSPQIRKEPELFRCAHSFRGTRKTTGQGRGAGIFGNARLRPAKRRASRPADAFARKRQCKKNAHRSGRRPAKRRAGPVLSAVDGSMRKRVCRRAPRRFSSGRRLPRPADVFTSSARILRPSRPLISKPLLHNRLSHGFRFRAEDSRGRTPFSPPIESRQTLPATGQLAPL